MGLAVVASLEPDKGGSGSVAVVEAATIDAVLAVAMPGQVTPSLVAGVEPRVTEAVGQGESHARVVGPLAGVESVRTAGPVTGHRFEAAGAGELDGRPESVANGEAQQRTTSAMNAISHGVNLSPWSTLEN